MIELILKLIFLNFLWVMAWKIGTSKGMIGEGIGKFGEKKIEQGYKIFDGLTECEWCLPNLHGIFITMPLAFLLEIMPFEWNWKYVYMWPFVLGGSSLSCGIVWSLYKHLELKHKYYEHLEQQAFYDLKERKNKYHNSKNNKP